MRNVRARSGHARMVRPDTGREVLRPLSGRLPSSASWGAVLDETKVLGARCSACCATVSERRSMPRLARPGELFLCGYPPRSVSAEACRACPVLARPGPSSRVVPVRLSPTVSERRSMPRLARPRELFPCGMRPASHPGVRGPNRRTSVSRARQGFRAAAAPGGARGRAPQAESLINSRSLGSGWKPMT